jgi:hypothetical protein
MKHSAHWFIPLLMVVSVIIGFLLHSENLSENIKKLVIVGSLFGIIGVCISPVED